MATAIKWVIAQHWLVVNQPKKDKGSASHCLYLFWVDKKWSKHYSQHFLF
jgi:hypothetical protein